MTLWTLLQSSLMFANAFAILHNDRFLEKYGWGYSTLYDRSYEVSEPGPMKKSIIGFLHASSYLRVPLDIDREGQRAEVDKEVVGEDLSQQSRSFSGTLRRNGSAMETDQKNDKQRDKEYPAEQRVVDGDPVRSTGDHEAYHGHQRDQS
eukprot:scaffold16956_cov40-Prasinocladus_malaysianus.AAC.2